MGDLALYRRNDGNFDLDFDAESGNLRLSESLENAVAISIGTFARERSAGSGASIGPKIGGFFGDALDESGTLGGYLYEAFPGKREEASLRDLESSASQSLRWMLDDGVAKAVSCTAKFSGENGVELSVTVEKPDGTSEFYKFEANWRATLDGV